MDLRFIKNQMGDKRPQLVSAIATIVNRYQQGESTTSAIYPPRFGKSTIIRGSALELQLIGAPTSICIVPWRLLADQIKTKEDIEAMFRRYSIPPDTRFDAHRCLHLPTYYWWRRSDGSAPTLTSMTVGLALANKDAFLDGIELLSQETGKMIPVFFDEAHLLKQGKSWGEFAGNVIDRGGYVVPLTGTPVPGIPGFKADGEEWVDATHVLKRKKLVDGQVKFFKEHYEGQKRTVEITADIEVSWREAWDVGALTRVNAIWVDLEVLGEKNEPMGKLSDLSSDDLNGRLKSIVEDQQCTALLAQRGVDRFLTWRSKSATKKAQMLVVTGFDTHTGEDTDTSNYHARQFKKAIENSLLSCGEDPAQYRIEIATNVTEDGDQDDQAVARIKAFRKGNIDILIVKMMGLVGLDVPELKVEVYAGMVRNGPLGKQALSRPLTVWESAIGYAADIVMPKDQKMQALFKAMITDQGGAVESNLQLVMSEEVEPGDDPAAKPNLSVLSGAVAGYSNEDGLEVHGDHEIVLKLIKFKYITKGLTDSEILENYQRGGYGLSAEEIEDFRNREDADQMSGIRDLDENLTTLQGQFGKEANSIVARHIRYGSNPKLWSEKLQQLQGEAKRRCGVRIPVPKIDDAELLERLIAALKEVEPKVFGNA